MGCDIHSVVQVKRFKETWETVEKRLVGDPRDYDYFAMLADVRNGRGFAGCKTSEGFEPISEPKGLPEEFEIDDEANHQGFWMGDHSWSYLTLEELLSYWKKHAESVTTKCGWVSEAEYKIFKEKGQPDGWSGGVSGGMVVHLDNQQMESLLSGNTARDESKSYYTQISWDIKYKQDNSMTDAIERLQVIAKNFYCEPSEVRFVFGFDS